MSAPLLFLGIVLFIGLIVVHEFGHFIAARRGGVKVEEFSIFFPPRLFKRKTKDGWLFSVGALPLGGFVRLKGEHDSDTAPGSFGAASLWVKTKIMSAGVLMNLAVALLLFTLIALVGMPKVVDNQFTVASDTKVVTSKILVGYIEPGSPADKAGLKSSDELVAIERQGYSPVVIEKKEQLPQQTKVSAGQEVKVFYRRDGFDRHAKLKLRDAKTVQASLKTDEPKGYLGVIPSDFELRRSTWSAPVVAAGLSAQLTGLTFQGLGHALAGLGSLIAGAVTGNDTARQNGQTQASADVAGPVGIFEIMKSGSLLGTQFVLFIVAYISLTLAIMNILPIPALDGGRLWLMLSSRGLKRPLSARAEENINAIGFVVLITLIILITIVDVKRFF